MILFSALDFIVTNSFVYIVISQSMSLQEAKRQRGNDLLRAGVDVQHEYLSTFPCPFLLYLGLLCHYIINSIYMKNHLVRSCRCL